MKRTSNLILITLATIASTYALVHYVKMDRFEFAFILNFMLMFFVLFFTKNLKPYLTSSFYDEKNWERKGTFYEYIGINIFRKILVWTGWEKLIRIDNPIEKNTKTLTHLYNETKKGELSHIIILVIVLGFNIFAICKFGFLKTVWLLILNILLHLYPIFLQRYNRPRLKRVLNLSNWREK
ncbi:hypothetical protein EZJ43_16560 [Pedobacter changchengzhani]|uniref:Glycosyl-4,4'-diaponeurosporenoate acyltransferase n=1 Tax=Pedobacter changchengzhani TaxID=2529274 RepID=A0A4R5MH69_9SPHI|nr:hypothetical protein [Pedobacter changchengzhani]TDG34858.1 hypothetical protein EZJ43_16560 [Pedobacter changchengzhani]